MVDKFKIKYDDYGRVFMDAKQIYDALEIRGIKFNEWWTFMLKNTGFKKRQDYIVVDGKYFVNEDLAKYFCREENIQVGHRFNCGDLIMRGYQVTELIEATKHFAEYECLLESAGADNFLINSVREYKASKKNGNDSNDKEHEYKPFHYQGKEFNLFTSEGKPYFIAEEISKMFGIKNLTEILRKIDFNELCPCRIKGKLVTGISEAGLLDLAVISMSKEAKDFYFWFAREFLPKLGVK